MTRQNREPHREPRLDHLEPEPGPVAVYAVVGALAAWLPLPIVPRRILRAIRGALSHDICARRGLSLSADAREVLCEPSAAGHAPTMARDFLAYAARFALARVVPAGSAITPLRNGYETLAFGRLFERHLMKYRPSSRFARAGHGRTVRIEGDEAAAIRLLIDRAASRVLSPSLQSELTLTVDAPEDHRTAVQRTVDGALIGAARLPEALGQRLDAALDEVIAEQDQHDQQHRGPHETHETQQHETQRQSETKP